MSFAIARFEGCALPREDVAAFFLQWDGLHRESVEPAAEVPFARAILRKFRWVIRDDDLKLLDALTDAVKSAAAVGFFTAALNSSQLASATVGLLVAGAKLARQSLKKGARLEPLPFRVLLLLKANAPGGLREAELLDILRRVSPELRLADVLAALTGLECAAADGSIQRFAAKDGTGRWHANGV